MHLTKLIINRLMSERQHINTFLKKVLQSNTFSKSVINKELLKYLVNQSRKGEVPKEYQIAEEMFGNKNGSNEDKNVRVYVLNLRKKLAEYYKTEGNSDAVKFGLPKGGYEITFKFNKIALFKDRLYKNSLVILSVSFVFIILSVLVFFNKNSHKVAKSFIWKDIVKSGYPSLIVLGDHYFFRERNIFGDFSAARVTDINSDEDLDLRISENPELANDILKTEQTYINKQAPFGLYKIMSFLGGGQTEIELQYSSNLQWEHVDQRNVIFIGSYKTQNILRDIHHKLGIDYKIDIATLYYQAGDSIFEFGLNITGNFVTEYASFSRFITEDGRNILSFMCNSDVGNIAVLKYMSDPDNLQQLEQLSKELESPNFKIVFEVRGQGNTDFQISLKRIDPITAPINEIWP